MSLLTPISPTASDGLTAQGPSEALVQHATLVEAFGAENIVLAAPSVARDVILARVLSEVGLPRVVEPLFWWREAEQTERGLVLGWDGERDLMVLDDGEVWAVDPMGERGDLYVNRRADMFLACLVNAKRTLQRLCGMTDDEERDQVLADETGRLALLDPSALSDPNSWWSAAIEAVEF